MSETHRIAAGRSQREAAHPVWREDLIAAGSATLLVIGLFLDGWNHINLQNGALGGFFTLWHGLLYLGFSLSAGWVVTRNPHLVDRDRAVAPELHSYFGVPLRYPFAIFGIALATIGMAGDLIWHETFGEEAGVARVIAPFHLLLFSGAALLIAAPVRSGWHARDVYPEQPSFRTLLPPLLALTLITSSIAFMFQWLSAFVDWAPSLRLGHVPAELAADERVIGTLEFASVARVLVTAAVLIAPLLLAMRRWVLPFGAATFLFTGVGLLMSALTEFRSVASVAGAFVGGIVADSAARAWRAGPGNPEGVRYTAAATAAATWTTYFVAIRIAYGTVWPFDLWAGAVGLSIILSVVLSFVTAPAPPPRSAAADATAR